MRTFLIFSSASLRPAHLLICSLANLLIFVACSKSNDEPTNPVKTPEHLKAWEIQPVVDTTQTYMTFATGSTTATLTLKTEDSATEVWVDTNNNGIFDEGDVKVTDPSQPVTFSTPNKVFTVYGKVTELNATGNALTAADVRKNEALTKLNVADNNLPEKALLELVTHLPTATNPNAAVVLRNTDNPQEKNAVTDAVLNTAKQCGWQALKTERGEEVPDLPTDTQAPTPATISERMPVTDQTATISWEAATDNKTSFEGLRYQVFWKANGSTEVQNSGTPQADMFSYVIKGLAPSTSYTVWVEVFDKANNKAPYPEKTFTTAKKEEPKPEPKDTHYIVLTTDKAVGKKVKLGMNAAEEDQAGVWLDLNGNGKWDEGIDQKPTMFFRNIEYTLQAQTFRIYGIVWYLNCEDNQLTGVDISQNAALTQLYAKGNKLSSIAHLEGIKRLSIDTHTLLASSLPKGLITLIVNETTPLTTIDTSPFTELSSLALTNCKNLKSLDLSKNNELTGLYVEGTGLTTLDLSHQPHLSSLDADFTPLTKLNIAGNKALEYVEVRLSYEGKGLQGTALMDFLRQLPTYEEGKEGKIYLSPAQATDAVKSYLGSKFWLVNP